MEIDFEDTFGWYIHKADLIVKCGMHRALKEYDITVEQFTILSRLSVQDGINQKALAKKCLKDQAALTRILDILEKKQLVKREIAPYDRREFLVFITDMGRFQFAEALPQVKIAGDKVLESLSKEETQIIKTLLRKFTASVE